MAGHRRRCQDVAVLGLITSLAMLSAICLALQGRLEGVNRSERWALSHSSSMRTPVKTLAPQVTSCLQAVDQYLWLIGRGLACGCVLRAHHCVRSHPPICVRPPLGRVTMYVNMIHACAGEAEALQMYQAAAATLMWAVSSCFASLSPLYLYTNARHTSHFVALLLYAASRTSSEGQGLPVSLPCACMSRPSANLWRVLAAHYDMSDRSSTLLKLAAAYQITPVRSAL